MNRLKPQDLQHASFRYIFSVDGMIKISRLIEDTVIKTPGVADMHVSFQYFSRIAAQEKQYMRVAEATNNLWLYGIPDAPLPKFPRSQGISTGGTPLEEYWFVVAYGPGIYATLLAKEIMPEDGQRLYEGFFTFETQTAYQIITVLHQMFPSQISEPVPPAEHK
jgi:hypothetical protein